MQILAIYRVIKRNPPTLKTKTYIINIIMMIDFFSSQIFSSYTIKMMLYIYWELYIFYSMAPKVRLKSQSKYVIKPELFSSRRVLYRNWTVPLLNLPEPKGPFMPRSVWLSHFHQYQLYISSSNCADQPSLNIVISICASRPLYLLL